MSTPYILIVYYSRNGGTQHLAEEIAHGVESVPGIDAMLRSVPSVSPTTEQTEPEIPNNGAPYVTLEDLKNCSGLALGSPTRFGNMAASVRYFLDQTALIWKEGSLINKPATVFTSTATLHGGQETTLLSMMLPLIHQGMVIVGVPFSESTLFTTQTGGTPYGASHTSGTNDLADLSKDEIQIARTQGKRLATLALKLAS